MQNLPQLRLAVARCRIIVAYFRWLRIQFWRIPRLHSSLVWIKYMWIFARTKGRWTHGTSLAHRILFLISNNWYKLLLIFFSFRFYSTCPIFHAHIHTHVHSHVPVIRSTSESPIRCKGRARRRFAKVSNKILHGSFSPRNWHALFCKH